MKKLFYRLMAWHYRRKMRNCYFDLDEARYRVKAAEESRAVWLKKIRECGL